MTTLADEPVIRRSALEAIHAALDARWIAEAIRWPEGYGSRDAATDVAAVAAGAGVAEIGPLDEVLLRGPGAIATAGRFVGNRPLIAGTAVSVELHGGPCTAWVLGPDEVLLLALGDASGLEMLVANADSVDVSAIEMTGTRTSLRLTGPAAPDILAELCQADTTPSTMAPATLIQSSLAGVRAFICREDVADHAGYTIMVARDEAEHVWDAIWRIGAAHGLSAVGPAAVAPRRAA